MRLEPVVILMRTEDVAAFMPTVTAAMERIETHADIIRDLLATRGWTTEMIAWSSVMHALADGIRSGMIPLEVADPYAEP